MDPFPHHYRTVAFCEPTTSITIEAEEKPSLITGTPKEFGGSGTEWSPEDLLVAAVANCYILSFRAVAKASRLDWLALSCDAVGTLDKVERSPQFTEFNLTVKLTLPEVAGDAGEADKAKAERLLHKAETICLITNSLKASSNLEFEIVRG